MKTHVEFYGDKIGVNGNLKNLIEKKEVKLLVTLKNEDDDIRFQFILNKEETKGLIKKLYDSLNDPTLKENGFTFV